MAKTTKEEEKAPTKVERLIYCGPSLPGGLLRQYATYKGGMPEHVQPVIEKCPSIKSLFVRPADLAAAQAAIAVSGSLENLQYQAVIDFISKGGLTRGL